MDAFRTRSRAEYVYQYMREAIRDGHFRQGDRIRENDIAKSLGVSRTPVREALRRLQTRGLLDFGAGRGLGVVELSRTQVLELYSMRELLEGAAARLAAQHATPTEVTYMRHLLDEFRVAKDPNRMATINRTLSSNDLRCCPQSILGSVAQRSRRGPGIASRHDVFPQRASRDRRHRARSDLGRHRARRSGRGGKGGAGAYSQGPGLADADDAFNLMSWPIGSAWRMPAARIAGPAGARESVEPASRAGCEGLTDQARRPDLGWYRAMTTDRGGTS